MLNSKKLQSAQQRYAEFYLIKLEKLAVQYEAGSAKIFRAVDSFTQEWEQIRHAFVWTVDNMQTLEIALLCSQLADIASIFIDLREVPRQRLTWYEPALQAAYYCEDNYQVALHLKNVGYTYHRMGKYVTAAEYLVEALIVAQTQDANEVIATIYYRQGQNCFSLGQYGEAREVLQQSLEIAEATPLTKLRLLILCQMAEIHQYQGDFKPTQALLEACLVGYEDIDAPRDYGSAVQSYAGFLRQKGN